MSLPKEDGGLGLRNPKTLNLTGGIMRQLRMWNSSIWADWVKERYVRRQGLSDITTKIGYMEGHPGERSNTHVSYTNNYGLNWKRSTPLNSFKEVNNCIWPRTIGDRFAIGIWDNNSFKIAIIPWKLKWGRLYTFDGLRKWGADCPIKCMLCDTQDESIGHLFFNFRYSRSILQQLAIKTNDIL